MIAEMRSYGQGVIISEQIPSKLAPDVIKNSSNKIIHRIVAKDDQEIIANMIGMESKDAIYLGDQVRGRALCHTEGMRLPISVAFPKVAEIDRKDGELRLNNNKQNFYILKSLLLPHLLEIDEEIPRLLNTLLTFDENNIKEGIRIIKEKAKKRVKSKEPRLLNDRQYDEAEAAIISEFCIKYLLSGVYYVENLPQNIYEKINKAVLSPYDVPVKYLRSAFIELDNKNDTVIQVVSELVLNYLRTHQERKASEYKLVSSYFAKVNEETVSKILNRIQDRKG
jgi:hypothetical protein